MAKQVQLRSGTTIEHSTFTGASGEVTVDTTKNVIVVHDGMTVGGTPMLKASDVPSASETVQGKIEIATQTEVNTGTDTTRAVVPSTLKGGIQTHLNVTGSAPMYACRAWVNFNGTGTVAIRASGNVSSITDNGVGDYTINFSTNLPDANYCVSGAGKFDSTDGSAAVPSVGVRRMTSAQTASNVRVCATGSSGAFDCEMVSVGVFR